MYDKIRDHVEFLFRNAPYTARAVELKEELIDNLNAKYTDLVNQGETEETAYGIAIAGIGDVDDLIRGLREQDVWNPANIQEQQQKSALLVSAAVGLFIASPVFAIICNYLSYSFFPNFFEALGFATTILCIALGVALLVYNSKSKPKYVKAEETLVEEFKEWNVKKRNHDNLSRTIQSIIWTSTVPIYLIIGLFFDAWHPGWLIFFLAPVVSQIVRLSMMMGGNDRK